MAANEKRLGVLHEMVTEALIKAVTPTELPNFNDDGLPDGTFYEQLPSAAIIQAASKFLKDNEITCAPAADNALGELERRMSERAERRKLRQADALDASREAGFLDRLN